MRFTIDTNLKTIQIQSSFKFEELDSIIRILPAEYRNYSLSIEPIIQKEYAWYPYSYPKIYPSWQYLASQTINSSEHTTGITNNAHTLTRGRGTLQLGTGNRTE